MADDRVRRLTVVIGAGPAGLAAAAALRARGVPSTIIERDAVAASWRDHYDRLHLHTVRWLSHLPGYRISREEGRWVSRDGVIRYLEHYAAHHELDIRTGVRVDRIEREPDGWLLHAQTGAIRAAVVVMATGYNHTPVRPDWPGRDGFTGRLLHARDYRNGAPYRERDVLVAGAGNTGAEIAVDLA
jgi:putative flavoprotein involved in K+ transport